MGCNVLLSALHSFSPQAHSPTDQSFVLLENLGLLFPLVTLSRNRLVADIHPPGAWPPLYLSLGG